MPISAQAVVPTVQGSDDRTPEQRLLALRELGHTLRTPLSAIIGFSEILAGEPQGRLDEKAVRDYAVIIHESGVEMLKLVNSTLADMAEEIRRSER